MKLNVGGIDRLLRITAGLVLIGLAATGTVGAWGWIGVVPLLTGALGFYPIYPLLGLNTCRMKRGRAARSGATPKAKARLQRAFFLVRRAPPTGPWPISIGSPTSAAQARGQHQGDIGLPAVAGQQGGGLGLGGGLHEASPRV